MTGKRPEVAEPVSLDRLEARTSSFDQVPIFFSIDLQAYPQKYVNVIDPITLPVIITVFTNVITDTLRCLLVHGMQRPSNSEVVATILHDRSGCLLFLVPLHVDVRHTQIKQMIQFPNTAINVFMGDRAVREMTARTKTGDIQTGAAESSCFEFAVHQGAIDMSVVGITISVCSKDCVLLPANTIAG